MVRVHRVIPLEEEALGLGATDLARVSRPPLVYAALPAPAALFELEGFEERQATAQPPAPAFRQTQPPPPASPTTAEALAALLQHPDDHSVYSAAVMAFQASGGALEAAGQVLARLGYVVRLHTSAGGSISSLKHTYLTAACGGPNGEPAEWVIDPSFGQAFAVTHPTPRYARILAAVPPLLVAPLPRLVRAVLLLGAELARCFEEQGVPLPPWRRVEAYATKYDSVASLAIHACGCAAPHAADEAAAAAQAAARRQQRERQQLERVRLRLAQLGLLEERPLGPASPASSCATSAGGSCHGESPSSVLAASQPHCTSSGASAGRVVGFKAAPPAAAAPAPCVCCRWRPKNFRPAHPAGQLGCRLHQSGAVASAT